MDRRRALKTIAAGSGVAIAGSTIVSSPAFAYDTPVLLTSGGISVTAATGRRIDVQPTGLGTASCPASANSTSASATFIRWELAVGALAGTSTAQVRALGGGGAVINLPTTYTAAAGFRIRIRDAAGARGPRWTAGDQLSVDMVVRFRCTYSDMTTRDLTRTFAFTLTKGGGTPGTNDWVIT